MTAGLLPRACPLCSERQIIPHCSAADPAKTKPCRWWRCLGCDSFGDRFSRRVVDKRPKKERAA